MDKINSFRGNNFFLSNFYEVPVMYQGIEYKNNEAAFQAQKTLNMSVRKTFANMNPSQAKRAGRDVQLRHDWESVKVQIMTEIVKAKFDQHPDLAQALVNTGDAYLEEGNNWGDRIWGTVNGSGSNLLGQILMRTRDELLLTMEPSKQEDEQEIE